MADLIKNQRVPIASYSYRDLESGSAYVEYYLYASNHYDAEEEEQVTEYHIGTEKPYSFYYRIESSSNPETITFYSSVFNIPKVINGTIIFNCDFDLKDGDSEDAAYIELKIYHYDGSTSTQLGDTWHSETISGTSDHHIQCAKIEVPRTKFKRGEQIKIELIIHGWDTQTSNVREVAVGVDPQNRTDESSHPLVTTQFKLLIPMEIQE